MSKKKPKKPSLPLSFINFSRNGVVSKVIEQLPITKEELEEAIVNKFLKGILKKEGREISKLKRGDSWPDFECREDNMQIGIELVEIINPYQAQYRKTQEDYENYIKDKIKDIHQYLSGLDIMLFDNYQDPPYPSIKSKEGKKLAQSFVNKIRSNLGNLIKVPPRILKTYKLQDEGNIPYASIHVVRKKPKEFEGYFSLGFCKGVYFPKDIQIEEALLSEAIKKKIEKRYQEYPKGKLFLLAYEIAIPSSFIGDFSDSVNLARGLLKEKKHFFDEVWYFLPYAGFDSGHCYKIWP